MRLKLNYKHTKKEAVANREFPESFFIPYAHHYNRNTVMLKNGSLMQVIKLTGFSFETADDEDLDIRKNIRNLLLKGIAAGSFIMYHHIVRRKISLYDKDSEVSMEGTFAKTVEQQWRDKHADGENYINELYITVVRQQNVQGVAFVENIIKKFAQKADKSAKGKQFKEAYDELEEMSSRMMSTLKDYSPRLLTCKKSEDGYFSEILSFLGTLVNCGASSPMLAPTMSIDEYLPTHRLYFGSRAIEVKGPTGSKFAGVVSIKEYPQQTYAGMMDSFLRLPHEMIITQSFSFIDRNAAITSMKLQQNRMIQAEDVAISQVAEINEALDESMSGKIGFGKHHLTVLCIEDSLKSLEHSLSMVTTELSNTGSMAVREKVNLEPCFWAQLPGNQSFAIRRATINTMNVAGFASFHNYPTGQETDNHWGDAVTVLDTTSGTPFFFNFHVRDVGHTTIIGPTGAGKTVLMNFLCAQAQKYNCRMFFFDKDRGAEIFIRALGGTYTVIDPSKPCGFNPLQLEDNGDNRTFLTDWLKLLVTVNGEPVNAEDVERISDAINGNFKLDQKNRVLRNVVPFFGLGGPGSLSSRVSMWHSSGSHASVFDNDLDTIDFTKSRIFGFEMAELLKDSASLGPALLYIFHRINASLDGTPTMIVLDEAWALIDNDVFAPKIKDWLKVLRKLNCFVIFATQSVEDASKSAISDTLIQQTATQIFLPNLKATDVYKTHFMMSEREFSLIKTTDPGSRFFLVKQNNDAVIARVDLSGMDDIINVLSGRADTVRLLDAIRQEVGDNPDDWLPIFYQRVKEI